MLDQEWWKLAFKYSIAIWILFSFVLYIKYAYILTSVWSDLIVFSSFSSLIKEFHKFPEECEKRFFERGNCIFSNAFCCSKEFIQTFHTSIIYQFLFIQKNVWFCVYLYEILLLLGLLFYHEKKSLLFAMCIAIGYIKLVFVIM